jgi:hypothetical protein
MKLTALILAASIGTVITVHAAPIWRCQLPGGTYAVAVNTISSVSTHEYLVDGVARVTELTVATTSSVVARFYHLEPITPKSPVGVGQSVIDKVQEKVEEATTRTGLDPVWKKVVKNYPVATHAHTVEYRLENKDDLAKIQTSLETAWRNNRDGNFKLD